MEQQEKSPVNGTSQKLSGEERYFDDLLSLSAKDVLNHFKCIPREEYPDYGIDEEEIPFGTFAALKHPTMFPTPLGGNAYGIGLIEQKLLTESDLRFLESIDLSDPSVLKKHCATINEIYRKMGLLIRLSHKGIFYYLIPSTFLSHLILDVRSKVNMIVSFFPEIRINNNLKIGIMTSPDDILVHELIGRFPHHRFVILSGIEEISIKTKPFDTIICPYSIEDYLKITPAKSMLEVFTRSREKLFKTCGYILSLIRRNLNPDGSLIIVSPAVPPKKPSLQSLTFTNKTYLKLFLAFTSLYRSPFSFVFNGNEEMVVDSRNLQTFLRIAPSVKTEIQKIFNRSFDQIDETEIISLAPRYKVRLSSLASITKLGKLRSKLFETIKDEEIFPEEYRSFWEKHITVREFPPLFNCLRLHPRKPEVCRYDIENFLERSPIAGCPVSLVADYKNTMNYIIQVLDLIEDLLSAGHDKAPDLTVPSRLLKILFSCRRKLDKVHDILGPPEVVKKPIRFFESIPELSLLGFSRSQLKEMGLIVTGHSSLGRVIMGKYPTTALEPLLYSIRKNPGNISYLIMMTMAELRVSLGRNLTEQEIQRIGEVIEDLLKTIDSPEKPESMSELLQKTYRRVMIMSRTDQKPRFEEPLLIPEKSLIKRFNINKDFLIAFLKARFHGTGHILPSLGFFPSLVLLWTCLTFWKKVYEANKLKTSKPIAPIVNLNWILRDIPLEHRSKQIEKLKEAITNAIKNIPNSIHEMISPSSVEAKSWFWTDANLCFSINAHLNTVDVDYLDFNEAAKVIEDLARHLESKSVRSIPQIFIQEADCQISKVIRYVEKNILISSALTKLWRSFFVKLFSPEYAYETITLISREAPNLLFTLIPGSNEERIYTISRAFRRLKSINEKRRSAFEDVKQGEFTPLTEERIGLTNEQFNDIEEMLSSIHADFSAYQAMIISLILDQPLHSNISQPFDELLGSMIKSGVIPLFQEKTIRKYISNILRARETITSVVYGRKPLISLGDIMTLNLYKAFVDASFFLVILLENVPKSFIEAETLNHILHLRRHILDTMRRKESWQKHMIDMAIHTGLLFKTIEESKIQLTVAKDLEIYNRFLGEPELKAHKQDQALLLSGRYIMAFDRLLKFSGLVSIQFKDAIAFLEGTPPLAIYRDKNSSSLVFRTFKNLLDRAGRICNVIFSYPAEQRLKLLSKFDELNPSTKIGDETPYNLFKKLD